MIPMGMGKDKNPKLFFLNLLKKTLPDRRWRIGIELIRIPREDIDADGGLPALFRILHSNDHSGIACQPGCYFHFHIFPI